jgi:DNA-binding FadR family transcriptional regulator
MVAIPVRKFETVERKHAADSIYEQLASAVLRGDFPVGQALPPERELAEQFGVSRTIARQAVHRLADMGLVRVRQGGATIVQDSSRSTDVRLLAMRYRVSPSTPEQKREFAERRMLEGFALVQLATYHATRDDIAVLEAIVERQVSGVPREEESASFERDFWTAMAEATHNSFYIGQLAFWNAIVAEGGRDPADTAIPPGARVAFYREIVRRMSAGGLDATQFYLDTVRPLVLGSPPKR